MTRREAAAFLDFVWYSYDVEPAPDREGCTHEQIVAEDAACAAAVVRMAEIMAVKEQKRKAASDRKKLLAAATRERHKDRDRRRKEVPTRKVRNVVYELVPVTGELYQQDNGAFNMAPATEERENCAGGH